MTTQKEIVRLLSERRPEWERFGVKSLMIFGSAACGEMHPESDVDILVEFKGPATFDRYMDLIFTLEALLGRPVDLVTSRALKNRACGLPWNRRPSVSRDPRLYLDDVAEACEKIQRYTHGMTFAQFVEEERTLDAVVRNMEIIGEAARHISENLRRRYPEVEWSKIVALRNIVAQEYFGVDEEIIRDVVQNKVPLLLGQIRHIL